MRGWRPSWCGIRAKDMGSESPDTTWISWIAAFPGTRSILLTREPQAHRRRRMEHNSPRLVWRHLILACKLSHLSLQLELHADSLLPGTLVDSDGHGHVFQGEPEVHRHRALCGRRAPLLAPGNQLPE